MVGLFVTGTGTGVGKTVVAGALVAALRHGGWSVTAHKPVVTGLDDPTQSGWPPDHELLAAAAGMTPGAVAPRRYGPAVSPHLAATLAGEQPAAAALVATARQAGAADRPLVVEGVGGLLVPLTDGLSVRDLAVALGLPVVVAAGPGLGTINHTLLTLEAARAAGLTVVGVVLTPWPRRPGVIERSNRRTIAELGQVEVEVLGTMPDGRPATLAAAGAALPAARWCGLPPAVQRERAA